MMATATKIWFPQEERSRANSIIVCGIFLAVLLAPMLLVHCLVDEKGSRLLKDSDLPKVKAWPASAFRRLATIAMRLNGFTEDAAGNSPETVNGASISA